MNHLRKTELKHVISGRSAIGVSKTPKLLEDKSADISMSVSVQAFF